MASRVEQEARRALEKYQGNRALAVRTLVAELLQDESLLQELVAPLLPSLAGRVIDRLLTGQAASAHQPNRQPPRESGLPNTSLPKSTLIGGRDHGSAMRSALPLEPAGYNPMRAADTLSRTPDVPPRPQASSRHVRTLELLAAAYRVKRGEG